MLISHGGTMTAEPKIHPDELRMRSITLVDGTWQGDRLEHWVDRESLQHIIDSWISRLDDHTGSPSLEDFVTVAFKEGFLLGVRFEAAGGRRPDDRKHR
jgi:hypothetical protein